MPSVHEAATDVALHCCIALPIQLSMVNRLGVSWSDNTNIHARGHYTGMPSALAHGSTRFEARNLCPAPADSKSNRLRSTIA